VNRPRAEASARIRALFVDDARKHGQTIEVDDGEPETQARSRAMDAHQKARLMALLGVAVFALGFLFWIAVGGIPD
jgi:hypothetical protein